MSNVKEKMILRLQELLNKKDVKLDYAQGIVDIHNKDVISLKLDLDIEEKLLLFRPESINTLPMLRDTIRSITLKNIDKLKI